MSISSPGNHAIVRGFSPEEAPTSAPAQRHDAATLLDDPEEWGTFGRPLKGSQTHADGSPVCWESFVVLEGMHCAACALAIEDALKQVRGILDVDVSAATHRARVEWNSAEVLPSQWMAAVRKAGYRCLPAMDALLREQRLHESRRALWRWLVAGFCMMQVMMYAWPAYQSTPGDLSLEMETLLRWASWVISLPVMFFACGPFFSSALRDIRERRVSMDLPVALGMLITFVVSTLGTFDPAGPFGAEVYYDSLTMFVFFLLSGRLLELRLRDRTAGALEAVANRLPDSVERRLAGSDDFERVTTRRLRVGDVVRVLPGEAFPADGVLVAGATQADEALMTGESRPVDKPVGALVCAGSYNLRATVEMRVEQVGDATRFAQVVALMESASLQKPRLAQLADKVARPFLVLVLLAALTAALWWWPSSPSHAAMVAVAVLIVTCPCALSLATPVSMLTAAGTLARNGVLVRNLQGLESLASVDTVVFDKTGTLTRDGLSVTGVHESSNPSLNRAQSLALAEALARRSLHPVSRAVAAYGRASAELGDGWMFDSVEEVSGAGVIATARNPALFDSPMTLRLGSASFTNAPLRGDGVQEAVLSLEANGRNQILLRFDLCEDVRSESFAVVKALQDAGIRVELLSGDNPSVVERVAGLTGIVHAHGGCTPQDKLARLKSLQAEGRHVAMVGDGLNDGPVLARAHVSFAFGRSVPLAQSRSDFVVMGDRLELVWQSRLLARRTMGVVRQNLMWAAIYNALCVPLAIAGYMPAWLAGLGMAASSLLVVLNAARLARDPELSAVHAIATETFQHWPSTPTAGLASEPI
ncbi:heavy metal translocating P-type ATPase [Diaphorobacter aerolatus]|uniref:Cation-translocating P-type ATPase n=1 Tax=Diaphorobacter aerolatus TaxID=1288495 RepID=A0A7H0GJ43_9BURK|nr:cation-translocating P-type ATPase [Diaphorobacter aerolatus]QNP48309.1 cation-translocating P-type ATPase [Diaphorobacter aerolatus]